MSVTKRIIRKYVPGKKEPLERIVYPVYNKETGEELVLIHGIDAREHVKFGGYSFRPIDGSSPILEQEVHVKEDDNVVHAPIVPSVDEEMNSKAADIGGLRRVSKVKGSAKSLE